MEVYRQKLHQFYRTNKRMPGYSEMCTLFGFASKNAVAKVVDKMIDRGLIRKDAQGKLIPIALGDELPLVGYVEAGFPSPAEEAALDHIAVDDLLLGSREKLYLLRVKGDSMMDAGIHEGDLLLVERKEYANVNDVVIANIDGEWTVKYLREKRGRKYLEAANDAYPDLIPESSLEIGGVVRSVIRTYPS